MYFAFFRKAAYHSGKAPHYMVKETHDLIKNKSVQGKQGTQRLPEEAAIEQTVGKRS